MDESFIPVWWPSKVGFVRVPEGGIRREFLRQEQKATLGTRRSGFALMACVADDPAIQRVLPQIILANKAVMTRADFLALGGHLRADNIFLLRRKSSWANTKTLVEFVELLSKLLEPLAQQRHVILTLDACPVHLGEKVARACARAKIFLHFVPGHMTGWLQPLDAYVFLPLKRFLRKGHHALQVASATGSVTTLQNLELLCSAIQTVLNETPWAFTFAMCGLSCRQNELGQRLRTQLHWDTEPARVFADLPTLNQLQAVWISGRHIPIGWLFSSCREVEPFAHHASLPAVLENVAAEPETVGRGGSGQDRCGRRGVRRVNGSSRISG